ncbi:MAG: phytanoyl-CoA dioxygenase family protein [Bryobacterales bacterium]|nr:phytanoyl-CoA dioxygenase family protein [Bryobacterales bacterium]
MATTRNFSPTTTELTGLDRDFRFYPSTVTRPRQLTPQQVESFNLDGYLKGFRIFTPEEAARVAAYFDNLLAETLAAGGTSYSISTAHLRYGGVYDILTNPRITGYVRDILGENVIGWGSHFFCKMPGDGKRVSWHQDASYWPLSPTKAVTVWLAIDDADVENACMRFIPGSHHFGHLTYRLSEADEDNVLEQTVAEAEKFGQPVDDQLQAGEISIHSDLLLHGSEANHSARRRCGLTLRYCPPDVRAGMGWNEKGVIVSGEDPSGHWANPPRPERE